MAIFAFASIALLGATGFGIDYMRVRVATAELQDRLDGALVAGLGKDSGARAEAAMAFFDMSATGSVTRVASRSFTSQADGVSGSVTAEVPTTLSSVIGLPTVRVTASGRASAPAGGTSCILVDSTIAADAFMTALEGETASPICASPPG